MFKFFIKNVEIINKELPINKFLKENILELICTISTFATVPVETNLFDDPILLQLVIGPKIQRGVLVVNLCNNCGAKIIQVPALIFISLISLFGRCS